MKKEDFLKTIASKSYDILYGAKLNFATHEIVSKIPGWINLVSLSVGILSLVMNIFSNEILSAIILILGVISLYISKYEDDIKYYQETGEAFTKMQNDLKKLYFEIESNVNIEYDKNSEEKKIFDKIDADFISKNQKKQIAFSGWRAHMMMFGQHQSDWIVKELNLEFWKDKIPYTLKFMLYMIAIILSIYGIITFFDTIICL